MSSICLFLSMHEPFMLRKYSVFDLGQNSIYEDDERNCSRAEYLAKTIYLPAIDTLLTQVNRLQGDFRFACHVSIPALELFEQYAPEVLSGLHALADSKAVEFVAGAAHSLAFLYSRVEFTRQLTYYTKMTEQNFGQRPTCFCSTELIYNNDFASCLYNMGYKVMIAEGADHILGWRSPNFVYSPENTPGMRLLLRNRRLSRDISLRFSDRSWDKWPLTAETYAQWCKDNYDHGDVVNLFMNMNVFGLVNSRESGIFDFLAKLPQAMLNTGMTFATPKEVIKRYPSRDTIDVKQFISWDDAGGDLNSWLGNDMQKDAVHFLYSLTERVHETGNPEILHDFTRLQTSNYLRWMSTKWFAAITPNDYSPFQGAQEAYTTYMNILADFEMRVDNVLESKTQSSDTRERKVRKKSSTGQDKISTKKSERFHQAKQMVA